MQESSRRKWLRNFALAGALVPAVQAWQSAGAGRMLVSGGNAVYDALLAGGPEGWRWEDLRVWRPERSKGLPASYALSPFATTDECKPIDDGKRVLVTSSAGGVAIFDRATHDTVFHARVGNAHSACTLPGGHVVVAASTHAEGNALVLFHRDTPEKELFRTPLYSGHGAYWDARRERLYALGMDTLEEYRFDGTNPTAPLRLMQQVALPSKGGHELSPAPEDRLYVSTESEVLLFDKDTRQWEAHPLLGRTHNVKCVSWDANSGNVAYVVPDGDRIWWSFQIRLLKPGGVVESPGQRVYKVRWG